MLMNFHATLINEQTREKTENVINIEMDSKNDSIWYSFI